MKSITVAFCLLIIILNDNELEAKIDCDANFKEMALFDAFHGVNKADQDYLMRNSNEISCISYYIKIVSHVGYDISKLFDIVKESFVENSSEIFVTTKKTATTKASPKAQTRMTHSISNNKYKLRY